MSIQIPEVSERSELPVDDGSWATMLIKAPGLIHGLGNCLALAATREASSISLAGSGLPYDDLATNLVKIANTGQNAFVAAYSDMLQIGTKTNNMARIDGILDQIIELMKEPHTEKAVGRLLARLQVDVKACDTHGERTERDFTDWRDGVQAMQEAVVNAQSRSGKDLTAAQDQTEIASADVQRKYKDFERAEEETKIARERHERALAEQKQREEFLQSKAFQAVQTGLATSGLPGAIIGLGIAQLITTATSKNVAEAMDDMHAQRRTRFKLEHQLLEIQLALKKHQDNAQGLNHLLRAIVIVLDQLGVLATNIGELILFFKRMNMEINTMVTEHEHTLKAIAAEQVNGTMMNNADFRSFVRSAYEMKKLALTVSALSNLYSVVISKIINPGFSLAAQASHYEEGRTIMVIADKQRRLNQYMQGAETKCQLFAVQAKHRLNQRLEEMEVEQIPDMQRILPEIAPELEIKVITTQQARGWRFW